jgi:hypothetical protein
MSQSERDLLDEEMAALKVREQDCTAFMMGVAQALGLRMVSGPYACDLIKAIRSKAAERDAIAAMLTEHDPDDVVLAVQQMKAGGQQAAEVAEHLLLALDDAHLALDMLHRGDNFGDEVFTDQLGKARMSALPFADDMRAAAIAKHKKEGA